MKKQLNASAWAVLIAAFAFLLPAQHRTHAAQLKQARVTHIVREVNILPSQAAPRPAKVNDEVRDDTAVRTGSESRTELTFADQTIARLGANTIFSFDEGTRDMDLRGGVMLLRVPKDAGGAKITTAAVTAAITGTTVLLEYNRDSYVKFIVLEGTARIFLRGVLGESVLVSAGQMLMLRVNPTPRGLPDPVDIDIDRILATSLLFRGFPPLGSESLMAQNVRQQLEQKAAGTLIDTNMVIFGRGTLVTLVDPQSQDVLDQRTEVSPTPTPQQTTPTPTPQPQPTPTPTAQPTPTPQPTASPQPTSTPQPTPTPTVQPSATPTPIPTVAPTPSKFGTPPVIPSPVPYVIASSTFIQTDPSITTNDITDYGKIYRGPADDGPFSSWAFTGTSAFDTASGIDQHFADADNLQISAFKFESLRLDGDPTISTENGGTTKVALISVGDMTSGATGATFRFAGLDTVLLATQSGSIRLSGIQFEGLDQLYFYARGATSDLVLGAQMTDIDLAILQAERDVQVNAPALARTLGVFAGNDFLAGTGPITATDILIVDALRNVNFTSSQFPYGSNAGHTVLLRAGNLMNIDATGDKTVFGRASSVDVIGGTINLTGAAQDTIAFSAAAPVTFTAGTGGIQGQGMGLSHPGSRLTLRSGGEIAIRDVLGGDVIDAATAYRSVAGTSTNSLTAGTTIAAGADLFANAFVTAGSTIDVAGQLRAPRVNAGGNVTANRVTVINLNAPNGVLTAGGGGITPFLVTPDGANLQHTFNVASVTSPNGINFNGSQFGSLSTAGGRLTINANTLTFGAGGIAFADFNGANRATAAGGSGGVLNATTAGDLVVNGPISATTGTNAGGATVGGTGGTVMLKSTGGLLSVDSDIVVSSNEERDQTDPPPERRSAAGGLLQLASGLTTGTAINIGPSAQLLGNLSGRATGAPSNISITSEGGDIILRGVVSAVRGRITIGHTGGAAGASSDILVPDARLLSEYLTMNAAANLTIGSADGLLDIRAVTIDLQAGNNLSWSSIDSNEAAFESPGNVSLVAGNLLSVTGDAIISRSTGGATTGLNITLNGGAALEIGRNLDLDANSSGLQNGGNISVLSGGDITIGDDFFADTVSDTSGLASGMNVLAQSGGTFQAYTMQLSALKRETGAVGSGANLTLEATTDIVAVGGVNQIALISMQVDNRLGGTIGTGGNITLRAGRNIDIAGSGRLILGIDNFGGQDAAGEPIDGGAIDTGANILVNAGGFLRTGSISAVIDNSNGGTIGSGGTINFQIGGNLIAAQDAEFLFLDNNVFVGGVFAAQNVAALAAPNSGIDIRSVTGDISVGGTLDAYFDNTGNENLGATGPTSVRAAGNITVGNRLNVRGDVIAGGFVRAGTVSSTNVSASSIQALAGGIRRFSYGQDDLEIPHTLTAAQITSQGGIDFSGREFMDNAGELTMNVGSINFASDIVGGTIPVNFNGGQNGGNGGTLTVNATGAITVNTDIEATTGNVGNAPPGGAGGTVNLASANDTVSVSSRVEVSSTPPPNATPTPPASARRSAIGGNITVQSGKSGTVAARAVAIDLANSSQLLSLLDAVPETGAGGKITIRATGANSVANIKGTVRADKGTVEIRNDGAGGQVAVSGPNAGDSAEIRADIVKVGALSPDGVLTLNAGSVLSGDSQVLLYGGASNGSIQVLGTVQVTNPGSTVLRANRITVVQGGALNVIAGANGRLNVFADQREWDPTGSSFGPINFNGDPFPNAPGSYNGGRTTVDPVAGGPNGGTPPDF